MNWNSQFWNFEFFLQFWNCHNFSSDFDSKFLILMEVESKCWSEFLNLQNFCTTLLARVINSKNKRHRVWETLKSCEEYIQFIQSLKRTIRTLGKERGLSFAPSFFDGFKCVCWKENSNFSQIYVIYYVVII